MIMDGDNYDNNKIIRRQGRVSFGFKPYTKTLTMQRVVVHIQLTKRE